MHSVRQSIFFFNKSVLAKDSIDSILKQYRSIQGKINTLKQQGYGNSERLKKDLICYLRLVDVSMSKKYARKCRKVKNDKDLRKVSASLNPLKKVNPKVNPKVKAVIDAEYLTAKTKIGKL